MADDIGQRTAPGPRLANQRCPLLLVVVVLTLAGCSLIFDVPDVPDDVASPSVFGRIDDIDHDASGTLVTLSTGQRILLAPGSLELTGPAAVGRVLIAGAGGIPGAEERPWFAAVAPITPASRDCYILDARGEVRDGQLATTLGFSVPLSDRWSESQTAFLDYPGNGFCLDATGAALRPYR